MTINSEKIIKLLEDALEMQNGELSIDSISENIEQWDSLGHLSILIALDKTFDGQIGKIKEMAKVDSVAKIMSLLKENGLELP
jgi:acyl carrier protein